MDAKAIIIQNEISLETVEYIIESFTEKLEINYLIKLVYLPPNGHEASILFREFDNLEEYFELYPEKLLITKGIEEVQILKKQQNNKFEGEDYIEEIHN